MTLSAFTAVLSRLRNPVARRPALAVSTRAPHRLDLGDHLRGVGREVADLLGVDAREAEQQVAGHAQGQRRRRLLDALCGRAGAGRVLGGRGASRRPNTCRVRTDVRLDVRLHHRLLVQLLLPVGGKPDLAEGALLGEEELRVEHCGRAGKAGGDELMRDWTGGVNGRQCATSRMYDVAGRARARARIRRAARGTSEATERKWLFAPSRKESQANTNRRSRRLRACTRTPQVFHALLGR